MPPAPALWTRSPRLGRTTVFQTGRRKKGPAEDVPLCRHGKGATSVTDSGGVVAHLVFVPSDRDPVTGIELAFADPCAVDLRAIAAVQVLDGPSSVGDRKFAVGAGHVWKPEHDVTTLPPANDKRRFQKGDRIAATHRVQFAVGRRGGVGSIAGAALASGA